MKRILILVNHEVVIYNFRRELVERLLEDDFEVYISSPKGERISDLVNMGCKHIEACIERHGTSIYSDLKLLKHYVEIMRVVRPNIVLSYTIKPNIYGGIAARFLKTPYIANITGLGTAVEVESIIQKVATLLYRISFKNVNCVFFQNDENFNFFASKNISNINKYRLIPGSGVNLKYFNVQEYPSDNESIDFLFVSRIMKEKGIDYYLETARHIRSKYPNTNFHIIGFCEDNKYLTRFNDMKGVIQYHGMQKDIRPFLKKCHCIIHPSYYPEGISNVLLESAASGRPVITTDRSGCKETVENGVSGFVVKQRDIKELILAVEKFIALPNEKKKAMGLSGRLKVEREFDRNIVVDAYLQEIKKIVDTI